MKSNLEALVEALNLAGADALFSQQPLHNGYLADFWEDGHERLLLLAVSRTGASHLICPALSVTQARRVGIENIASWTDSEDPYRLVRQLAEAWDLRTGVIFVDHEMPAGMLLHLQDALPTALFRTAEPVLSALMRTKQPGELAKMREAARIADETFESLPAVVVPGATEREIDAAIRHGMKRRGGVPTFCIVGIGPGGAEPHHLLGDATVRPGDVVLMDFGCEYARYQSDITRVVAVGEPEPEAKRVYEVVYAAHMAGLAAVRPGVTAGQVDAATRQVIEAAGYGPRFVHRTGHGIGMRGHEAPYIMAGSDVVLQPGDCFSIEPGVYLEGRFGVRLETIVTVTEDGCENLNAPISPTLPIWAG
ncbi:MAG: Xaa-Pro peptidase family protein [Fimbriimonadaceae bacterium]|nr:Xaa-Pro peptidase family protein [Fimbriimonadaceae bacterium]